MFRRAVPLHRRLVALLVSIPLVLTGALVVSAAPAAAAGATSRAFTPAFTLNANGDVAIVGNGLMTCPPGSLSAGSTTLTCANVQAATSDGQNNNFAMTYVDTDSDATTFDSSSATLNIPVGATVRYAGLSWAGYTGAGSLTNYPALTGVAAPNSSLMGNASFMAPGAGAYASVTSTRTDVNGSNYQAFADVTATVAAAGSGTYTVANVQAGTGGNGYAAWSLAVAYQLPSAPMRNLVIYTGYNSVSSSAAAVTIPVSGFTTPATGTVVTRVGVVGYEGDRGLTGDGLSVGTTGLSNSVNPASDIFNSSITDLGVRVTSRTPSYANTLGVDIDRFDATGAIANGATSTTISLTTSGETYFPGMVTFATDLYASAVTATQTVTDATSGNSTVSPNDRLNHSLVVRNSGGDPAAATVLSDSVPVGETFVPGTLTIGGTAVTGAAGDDTGEVNGANITARLGTGATATSGGVLSPGASTTVTFATTVDAADTDGQAFSNTATFTNTDQTTGTGYSGASNVVTTTVTVPPTPSFTTVPAGEVGATYASTLTETGGTGPYTWSVSSGTLPAGVSLSSAGVLSGSPTAAGTSTVTFTVTDANGHTGSQAVTFTVRSAPVLTFSAPASGEVGVSYSTPFSAAGGTGPYTYALTSGTLPAGVTLNVSNRALSGTPTASGTFPITLQATDTKGVTSSQTGTITIVAGPVTTFPAPPAAVVTTAYSDTLTASGGTGPYTWSKAGALPPGITLTSGGVLSGTPTTVGPTIFTVTATDARGQTATTPITFSVVTALTVSAPAAPVGQLAKPFTDPFTAAGGTGPYSYSISAGALPSGLTLDAGTGIVSGTPTATGSSTFTVRAADTTGQTATRQATVTVQAGPSLTFVAPASGQLGTPYSNQLTETGGSGPFTWSVSSGTLPDGVSLDPATGLVSATPTTVGTTNFTVKVLDATGRYDTKPVNFIVGRATAVVTLATSAASVAFGTPVTLTATVGGIAATGSVLFTEVPVSGVQSGATVTLGTGSVSGGVASVTAVLPAFGANAVTAVYSGDTSNIAATSPVLPVEVHAVVGEVIVREFRLSGPGGSDDSYVELYNTGVPIPLAGFAITSGSGATTVVAGTAVLGTNRSYLVTGRSYSLGPPADDPVASLGTGGLEVVAPDTALTQTDAVGAAAALFHRGTGLADVGTSAAQYAWVRSEVAGRPVDTGDNAADFRLVSTTGATVGGVQSALGSAAPIATTSPYQHNAVLPSALFDPSADSQAPPNKVYVAGLLGSPGTLTIRRTITNTSGATITSAEVRITAVSEANGAAEPGVGPQPARVARLRIVDPSTATSAVLRGLVLTTVHNLSPEPPTTGAGGGLNTTLAVPLPDGGLADGARISVSFTFAVDTRGTYWFGYDVDASSSGQTSQALRRTPLRGQGPQLAVARAGAAGGTGRLG